LNEAVIANDQVASPEIEARRARFKAIVDKYPQQKLPDHENDIDYDMDRSSQFLRPLDSLLALPHAAALLCNAPISQWRGYSHGAGTVGA
jgi:hypothetical protein